MALDPFLKQMLDQIPLPSAEVDIPALRSSAPDLLPILFGPQGPIPVAAVEDRELISGGALIPLRIFRPIGEPKGTLQFIHGGGWALGGIDFIEPVARRLARDLSMTVVASGYRLAPEHPFPAGFEDCLAAARWVLDHAAELGGDDRPVVLGGESAGANLAAAVALALRADDDRRAFDAQLLFYPAVDLRDQAAEYPSRRADADPTLPVQTFPQLVGFYCAGHDPADPRISPLAADTLDRLPPAVVVVLTVDPLHDEGVAYAERLRAAGVPVDLIEFEHLTHGFPGFAAVVPAAAEATDIVVKRLEAFLADLLVRA